MLSKLTIKMRLIATMGVLGLLIAVLVGMSIYGLSSVNAGLKEVYSNQLASTRLIGESQILLGRSRFGIDRAILHPEAADMKDLLARAEGFMTQSDTAWKSYLVLPQDADEKKLSDAVDKARADYSSKGFAMLISHLREGRTEQADVLMMNSMQPLYRTLNDAAEELSKYQTTSAARTYQDSQDTYQTQVTLAIAGLVLGMLLIIVSSLLLLRAIFEPLDQALRHFASIADGNLANDVVITRHDEMGELLTGLATMQTRLAGTVRGVRDGSAAIATASNEIASGNLDLSSRTEQQASSLEETASSLEELTSTVKQNSDNARQANVLAQSASQVAVKGGALVSQVVQTMGAISDSSKKIADIIGVIDGIAFQTNILALNAAVEAARAGEQGRGFAVVATEVRNLAHRSASAAKDIKTLIDASVQNVASGGELVGQAGSTMDEIVASIARVTDIMSEISAAGHEQELGIGQINQAVAEMDTVTQQNAALVEEAAAASEALQEQAATLSGMVSAFRLDDSHQAPAPRKTVTAPLAAKRPALSAVARTPTQTRPAPAPASRKVINGDNSGEWEEF